MSESGIHDGTGDDADLEAAEIVLTFEDHTYRLGEFTQMIEGVEALVTLGSARAEGLEILMQLGGDPIVVPASVPTWYEAQREAATRNVIVEKVSLGSPLVVTIIVLAGYMSTQLALMFRTWISVKNELHKSQRLSAETDTAIARAETEREIHEFLGNVISGRISVKHAKTILSDPTIRKVVEQASTPLGQLQRVEVKAKPVDSDVK